MVTPAIKKIIFLILTFSHLHLALALITDDSFTITASEGGIIDLTNNTITYRGDVIFEGGDTRLEGHEITTYANENNEYNEIIAEGEPASYSSTPADAENLYAVAKKIRYFPLELQMYLYTDASIAKEDKYLTGQYIEYDMNTHDITSKANSEQHGTITIFKDN